MLSDIEIANQVKLKPITEIAEKLGLKDDEIEFYGKYKAKINENAFERISRKDDGKLILVTAINPTPAGEGKTTVTIGLGQALNKINKKAVIALREPSMGPVFGIKGGATGGGYSQVLPMEDINLHFTGDMHAITSANNLLCAVVDNHIHQGNSLNIDPRQILVKRCVDMNDRALRNIVIGLGGTTNGIPREDGFIITVATEVMAILCLAQNLEDLRLRLGNILVAYSYSGEPIFAKDLKVDGAMTVLLKDAINPNLVQTIEGNPVIIHGGPFANIAHGCNSIRATELALKLGDYCVTEAGFGADLGAEKFLNIKCRVGNLKPSCVVLVATLRALKYSAGVKLNELSFENVSAVKEGVLNLGIHIENLTKQGLKVVVALNKFENDCDNEIQEIKNYCDKMDCKFAEVDVYKNGGNGAINLADIVCEICEEKTEFRYLYDINDSVKDKILKIAKEVYRADDVVYSPEAEKSLQKIKELKRDNLPICIAKTPYSLSDDQTKIGVRSGFDIHIKDITISNGAGFIVVLTGKILKMPGLPKIPASEKIDIDNKFKINGLF